MGLDQYARVCQKTDIGEATVDFSEEGFASGDFFYWRKHPDLHGWMEKLYREKGGRAEDFNEVPVRLTTEDLNRLESAVESGLLPSTTGFFFGSSDNKDKDDDLKFIAKARELLADGMAIYYTSWW